MSCMYKAVIVERASPLSRGRWIRMICIVIHIEIAFDLLFSRAGPYYPVPKPNVNVPFGFTKTMPRPQRSLFSTLISFRSISPGLRSGIDSPMIKGAYCTLNCSIKLLLLFSRQLSSELHYLLNSIPNYNWWCMQSGVSRVLFYSHSCVPQYVCTPLCSAPIRV